MEATDNKQQLLQQRVSATELYQDICNLPVTATTSLKDVYLMNGQQISALAVSGKDEPIKLFKLMLVDLAQYFAVTFTDGQVTDCARIMYDKFFYWHETDLKRFMDGCKGLNFGKPYGAVSVVTIMEWGNEYDRQRWEMINTVIRDEWERHKECR